MGTLSYTANDVLLTLTSQLAQTAGLNQNQRAVATSLDTVFNAGNSLAGSAQFLPATLLRISPRRPAKPPPARSRPHSTP